MKAIKVVLIAVTAMVLLPACSNNTQSGVTKAQLDEVRTIAEKARSCCASNTARIDRMFEKAMAK